MITPDFLFLHIPRTGGTSLERSLSLARLGRWFPDLTDEDMDSHLLPGPGRDHQHWKLQAIEGHGLAGDQFRFSFVRNPWALVVSEISYFRMNGVRFLKMTWKEAIRKLIEEPELVWGHDFQPQISWLLNRQGEPEVDFVGRTECLVSHFELVCERLGLQCPALERELPASESLPPLSEIYDDESREWVARKFSCDIEVFGYKFPNTSGDDTGFQPMGKDELVERFQAWRSKNGISPLAYRGPVIEDQPGPDGRDLAAKYRGLKAWGWYLDDAWAWSQLFGCNQPVRALEIGAFDGVSSNLMLDFLFTHPSSEVHVIDPFEVDRTTPQVSGQTRLDFHENRSIGGHGERLHLHEDCSAKVLGSMLASDDYWESFDFIYIDGSHLGKDVLTDAVMAWNLLKVGGVLAFDDYQWQWEPNPLDRPKAGIDAFHSVFAPRLELLRSNARRIWRKM